MKRRRSMMSSSSSSSSESSASSLSRSSSPASSTKGGRKEELYVVCEYSVWKYRYTLHRLQVSDIKWNSSVSRHCRRSRSRSRDLHPLPKPALKLPSKIYPSFMGFLVYESKIYFFGGQTSVGKNLENPKDFPRDCYVYDTSNPWNGVQKGPQMNFGKFMPLIFGPIDKYFYVLSISLAGLDFEAFDPVKQRWIPLRPPPLPSNPKGKMRGLFEPNWRDYEVISNAIVGNRIFLSTPQLAYVYHVNSLKWSSIFVAKDDVPFTGEAKFIQGLYFSFSGFRSDLYAYRHEAKDMGEFRFHGRRVHGLKGTSNLVFTEPSQEVVPLGDGFLSVVRSGFRGDYNGFHVTVDLCKLTNARVKSNGKLTFPTVLKQYRGRYLMAHYPGNSVFVNTCFAK